LVTEGKAPLGGHLCFDELGTKTPKRRRKEKRSPRLKKKKSAGTLGGASDVEERPEGRRIQPSRGGPHSITKRGSTGKKKACRTHTTQQLVTQDNGRPITQGDEEKGGGGIRARIRDDAGIPLYPVSGNLKRGAR